MILEIKMKDDSIEYLFKVNAKCEQAWALYFKYVVVGFLASMIASFLGSILSLLLSHEPFNRDNLYLQYKLLYVNCYCIEKYN